MGVLDKIKNALFEVEYVEVDEPPKKEKKSKIKEKREDRPIAKKVVLPGKREQKIEELHEEELKDEDFEIRPKDEFVKEKPHEEFKFMDDKDFKVEDEYLSDEPEILQVFEKEEVHNNPSVPENVPQQPSVEEKKEAYSAPEELHDYYTPTKPLYSASKENKLYGVDNSYSVPVHEYGTYEKKEEKTYFKPSPIISPIYGILDKNYKKEDVREKKEVRITSSYSRTNVSVDDIRNKAYGRRQREEGLAEEEPSDNSKFEVEEEDDNLLVDLSDRSKPEVKELTMGDALEYFQDLGLEYNVDYVDVSKEKSIPKKEVKEKPVVVEETQQPVEEVHPVVEVMNESENTSKVEEDNDNLFDLIDSMYQEKD